jgi:hypothetical protein
MLLYILYAHIECKYCVTTQNEVNVSWAESVYSMIIRKMVFYMQESG